ncbi:MAG: metallophosphoesterase [Sulfuritalea sp.]|nr:metallophosphoesterase [Sulfuritalea sp.]
MRNLLRAAAFLLVGLAASLQALADEAPFTAAPKPVFPLTIGMVADSQITTVQGAWDYGMRRKYADRFAGVAIRPPAVEYLSDLMLDRFLRKLEQEKVDVILYLGDGANSGCKDELDKVFSILDAARKRSGIPSYYVIGNHDYMGTGNQVKSSIRAQLCSSEGRSNPAETKLQVLTRISEHNAGNKPLDKFFDYKEVQTKSTSRFAATDCGDDDNTHYTYRQTASLVSKAGSASVVELFLLDTSDYRDVWFKPVVSSEASGCEILGGWGVKGSVSYEKNSKGSQIDDFVQVAKSNPDFRLMASHYRPTDMNALVPFGMSASFVRDALGDLLSKGDNVWLSGHTHTCNPQIERFRVGRTLSKTKGDIDGVNVGSTTDYNAHAVVVGPYTGGTGRVGKTGLSYRKIPYSQPSGLCDAVNVLAEQRESSFTPICGSRSYKTALGIDKKYQQRCFQQADVANARSNIDLFAADAATALATSPDEVKACLAYAGSKREGLGKTCVEPR